MMHRLTGYSGYNTAVISAVTVDVPQFTELFEKVEILSKRYFGSKECSQQLNQLPVCPV